MARPRHELVSLDDTTYYHCVSRCVRRAFLCGEDPYSGQDYSHRKIWVKDRLAELSSVFTIEICGYAVMSNHCHLVLWVDVTKAKACTDTEVVERWLRIFKGPQIVRSFLSGTQLSAAELAHVSEIITRWRDRLTDISWYMRCLNEYLARRANAEDGVTGRFWEGRFKCQALLDDTAVITAMAYVDLNPIRAGVAEDVLTSMDSSASQRCRQITGAHPYGSIPLKRFVGVERGSVTSGLPFNVQDYLDLVDWSGRAIRDGNCGAIRTGAPGLLHTLGVSLDEWLPTVTALQQRYELVIGSPRRMREKARSRGAKFHRGYRQSVRFYLRS